MNILKKVAAGLVLSVAALTVGATPVKAAEVFGLETSSLRAMTAEISATIAREVAKQLRQALDAPRPTKTRSSPSVTITETAAVVVEASRLPADGADSGQVRTVQVYDSGTVRF